jgi:rhodanese-related sulfurtransferase
VSDETQAKGTITVPEVVERLQRGEPTVLIDVRFGKMGDVPGSVAVPVTDLEDDPRDWDREALLVVFCQHGHGASEYAQEVLREQGYDQVVRLTGGVDAWVQFHHGPRPGKEAAPTDPGRP